MFNLSSFNAGVGEFLGVTTWWTVNTGIRTIDQVKMALAKCNLDEDFLREPTAKRAFLRASKCISRNGVHKFSRKIRETQGIAVVGVVSETTDTVNENLTYEQVTTAKLDKDTGRLTVKGSDSVAVEEIRSLFDQYKTHLTDADVRQVILNVIRSVHGVTLRETGGIYFVPEAGVEKLADLDSFLNELGMGSMYVMRVPAGEGEKAIAWEAAKSDVEQKIQAVLTSCDNFVRISALEKQNDNIDELREMTACYSKLTGMEAIAEEIQEKLQMAEAKVVERINAVQKNRAERVEAVKNESSEEKEARRNARQIARLEREAAKKAEVEADNELWANA